MRNEGYRARGYVRDTHEEGSIKENDLDLDEGNQILCRACSVPIFSTPYRIREDDEEEEESVPIFSTPYEIREEEEEDSHKHPIFHKCCAQLPEVLMEHPLHMGHPIQLHDQLLDSDHTGIICDNCRRPCQGFFYQCPNEYCRFTLDIQCAVTVKIVHRSHKHELALIISKSGNLSFTCEVCGLKGYGDLYRCDWCNFYLHRDCASLPNTIAYKEHHVIKGQPHFLTLVFVLPAGALKFIKSHTCSICHQKLSLGIYSCTKCEYAAHIKCVTAKPSRFHSVSSGEIVGRLPHFPMKDEHQSLTQYLHEKAYFTGNEEEKKKFLKGNIHDHDLVLMQHEDKYGNKETMEAAAASDEELSYSRICNACIDPISPSLPFYTCSHAHCTHFYLHKSCTSLPLKLQHPLHYIRGGKHCKGEPLVLLPTLSPGQFLSMFGCTGCGNYCNGFVYLCEKCGFKLDVKCALLPDAITYEFHGKSHILFLSSSDYGVFCKCCNRTFYRGLHYICSSCLNFKIDVSCALLPSSMSHKYDRHPLKLILPYDEGLMPKDIDMDICEICENTMVKRLPNYEWFYHCKECITSFHRHCIPTVGTRDFKNLKFGGTIRVRCHDCVLTSIQLLISYSYTCGLCGATIQGKESSEYMLMNDSTAFECTKCGFWLHYDCAQEE